MKKWKITYTSTNDHDCCSVWCYAENKEDAIDQTKREYWDVEEIISVSPLR